MNAESTGAFAELERSMHAALETYSNVHRGSGHYSMVTTHLFEQARKIVLDYLGLDKGRYVVIFCTARRAEVLKAKLKPGRYHLLSSQDIGLSLGVRALAVRRKALPKGVPFQSGGGTARLISRKWVIWAGAPDKFEAGTPAIINIIAFARALLLIGQPGMDGFLKDADEKRTAYEIFYRDGLARYSGQELLNLLRQTLAGRHVTVPTIEGNQPYTNLDNAASTPTFEPVWDAFRQALQQPADVQQEIIWEVSSLCSQFLGAPLEAYDMIFTSNTTEAINLAADSLGNDSEQGPETVVLSTYLEHSSNDLPWRMIPNSSLIRLSSDDEGFIDLNELDTLLCEYNQDSQYGKRRIKLVAVSGASNVLGTFNDLEEISRIVHRYGARLLVDAAQLVAHRKVDMEACGIDYLAFSAHKVYAPFGTGVLVVRKGLLNFSPKEMTGIQSSGEENIGGIAALGKALVILDRIGPDLVREEEQALTARLLRGLSTIPGLKIYGTSDTESPRFARKGGVIVFTLGNKISTAVAKELAELGGIGTRCGCHCSHILVKRLVGVGPLLEQFQRLLLTLFPKLTLPGLVRVSLGIGNTTEDVDTLIHVLEKIAGQPRGRRTDSSRKGTSKKPKADIKQQMNDFVEAAARRVYPQS